MSTSFPSADAEAYSAALRDPRVERRVRKVVTDALRQYEYIMEWGSSAERMALMKSALPNLIRELARKDEQARNDEMAKAYQELREAFQAHVHVRLVGEDA